MKEKIISNLIPIFYMFCGLCLIIGGISFYKINIEKNDRLLTIEEKVDIKDVGESLQLQLNNNSTDSEITYEIQNEDIVKIDENGVLVGVSEGTTTVTVTNKDTNETQTIVVNVGDTAIKEYVENNNSSSSNSNGLSNSNSNTDSNVKPSSSPNTSPNPKPSSSPNTSPNPKPSSSPSTSPNPKPSSSPSTKPTPSTKPSPTPNAGGNNDQNKTIKVTGVSIKKTNSELYINSNNKTTTLTANILPTNATNKNVTWSSSNTSVATVSNGIVTGVGPGIATISVKTEDGNHVAETSIIVKKKVIIIIGASQVTRMEKYKNSYSSTNYNYNTSNGTLVYVQKGGSGIDYQTNEGLTQAKKIMDSYSNVKNQVYFYLYFPLSGNTIRTFTCGQISTTNASINNYAKNYDNAITSIRSNGYNINGYVISMHPVKITQAISDKVVSNQNTNSCKADYRSNWKYYKFNLAIENIIKSNYNNIYYEELFTKIMNVNDERKNFSFKITYNTDDGVHWDSATTNTYVNMMLQGNSDL